MLTMHARLGIGFYYFLAYCLFSIAAGTLLREAPTGAAALAPHR
jgi:hypothetical protein